MKYLRMFSALIFVAIINVNAQTGIHTLNPNNSNLLEVNSNTKGLLIPSMGISNANDKAPIISQPKDGLLVYNTNSVTKRSLFIWNALTASTGNWDKGLFFYETPKTALIGITGDNITGLDNGTYGANYFIGGSTNNFYLINNGNMGELSLGKLGTVLAIYVGVGEYVVEVATMITAPVPDNPTPVSSTFGSSGYYNMGYFVDFVRSVGDYQRVERGILSQANEEHRVTFIATMNYTSSGYMYFRLGRRLGSTHYDVVSIIPSKTFVKITKIK